VYFVGDPRTPTTREDWDAAIGYVNSRARFTTVGSTTINQELLISGLHEEMVCNSCRKLAPLFREPYADTQGRFSANHDRRHADPENRKPLPPFPRIPACATDPGGQGSSIREATKVLRTTSSPTARRLPGHVGVEDKLETAVHCDSSLLRSPDCRLADESEAPECACGNRPTCPGAITGAVASAACRHIQTATEDDSCRVLEAESR
jgi:hypothetical protein